MSAYLKFILWLSLLLSFLSPRLGYCGNVKKLHYYIGGGGEPDGDTTLFDADVSLMAKFIARSPDWKTTVSFNGGHSKTEEIIKTKMPNAKKAGDFTEASYNALLDEMIRKIESGELKAGDQLMINIDSHGAKKGEESTHRISVSRSAATDLINLSGTHTVNLDRLEKLAKLAGDRGVKLAILDASCFSGNLLNIKNDKVCLISATGTDQYAYSGTVDAYLFSLKFTFSGNFVGNFNKGVNLEDAFLEARKSSNTPDFPMISTPEGRAINDLMYKMISPYLNYNEDNTLNYTKIYPTDSRGIEGKICEINLNHNQLQNLLKQFENMLPITERLIGNDFRDLVNALERYRKFQIMYEKVLRARFEIENEVKDIIKQKTTSAEKKILQSYSFLDLLNVDFEKQIGYYKEWAKKTNIESKKNYWNSTISALKAQKIVVEKIKLSLSDSAKNKLKSYDNVYSNVGRSKYFANSVATEAKKVYLKLYKKQMKKNAHNPCRDFVL